MKQSLKVLMLITVTVVVLTLAFPRTALGQTTVTAYGQGLYCEHGVLAPLSNYGVGWGAYWNSEEHRNFFVFDLTGVSDPVRAATLRVYNPPSGFESPDPSETWVLYDVTTDISALLSGAGGIPAYDDLGSGASYGDVDVTVADNDTVVEVDLNPAGIAAINAALGGDFAIGGALSTISGSSDQYVFGGSGGAIAQLVVEIDEPPNAEDDAGEGYETDEDTPFTTGDVLENDTDPEDDALSVDSFDDSGTLGVVTDNGDGTFDYDPDGQFEWMCEGWMTADTFEYTVTDEYGATDDATVTITINGVNDAPTPSGDEYDTTEDTILTVGPPGILSNDTDPDAIYTKQVKTVDKSATRGIVNYNAEGWINYDPAEEFEHLAVGETGTDNFTYTVEDDYGATANATVTITIHGVNDAPTAVDDTAETDEDTPLASIIVLDDDTDPDTSDVLTVHSFDDTGTEGTVTPNPDGTFDYDPDGEFEYLAVGESGTDSFEYTVTDSHGGFATATVTITIHGVNDPPTAVDDTETTDEDTPLEDIIVLDDDTDPDDSDVLTVESFDDTGTIGAVTLTGDTFDYDPVGVFDNLPDGAEATDIFTYTVSDGNGGTDDATVTITIEGVNDPPVGVDDVYSTDEDTDLTVEAPGVLENDTDPDEGYTLEVSGVDDGDLIGTLISWDVDGSFHYTPTDQFQYLGRSETFTETFTYTVEDEYGATASATVSITIAGVNDPPTAGDDTADTPEETPRTIAVLGNDNDPDTTDTLFVSIVGPPTNGDASTNGTTVTYTPTQDFSGADVFTYTVSDGELTDIAQVDILVGATNDPPNAEYNTVTTKEDTLVKLNVLDNDSDPDGDSIMVVALGQPQHGAATYNGPIVTYTPTLNFNGNDVFTYTISDGELTDTAEIEVVVESVNDPPTISAILDQYTDMNEPVGPISFTIGDVETPVGDLALSCASSNAVLVPESAMHINRSGANCTFTINPTLFMWGTSTITLTVSDGTAHTSEEFVLTVIEGPVEYIYLPHIFKPYLPPGVKP
jgi:VCBS repeat-containing protein